VAEKASDRKKEGAKGTKKEGKTNTAGKKWAQEARRGVFATEWSGTWRNVCEKKANPDSAKGHQEARTGGVIWGGKDEGRHWGEGPPRHHGAKRTYDVKLWLATVEQVSQRGKEREKKEHLNNRTKARFESQWWREDVKRPTEEGGKGKEGERAQKSRNGLAKGNFLGGEKERKETSLP